MSRKSKRRRSKSSGSSIVRGLPAGRIASAGEGRFVLQARLGAGGMCEVFSALDLRRVECGDSRPLVAVKRLLPEFAQDPQARSVLAREYFILRRLAHPAVVRVFDLHREGWGLCFSMELLEGQSACAALGGRPVGLGMAGVTAGARIFGALAYLHAHGVAHGDVKPANVFLEQDGRTVLLDFNVSRVSENPGGAAARMAQELPDAVRVPGLSPLHASPESLEGAPPDSRGDVFSASCTVYELITNAHPFRRLPALEAARQGLSPGRPSGLTGRQWRALRGGLAFEAEARPTSRRLFEAFDSEGWFAAFRGVPA